MKLTLVGAGPGDPDLITLKGLRALQRATVVMYDALVHRDLLAYCPKDCILVNVGKRYQKQSCNQDVINFMIVEYVLQYGEVVRLKGGDPYVFGRGYEEAEYAGRHGIATEVIPGISSSYAVPALSGIPLTVRGLSESFWVVTGTTKNHELSADLKLAARSTATVVVLMGMNKLPQIVAAYAELGKLDEPVAIIQNGTLPDQRTVTGRIGNIQLLVQAAGIGSPSVIVIGRAAGLADEDLVSLAATGAVSETRRD